MCRFEFYRIRHRLCGLLISISTGAASAASVIFFFCFLHDVVVVVGFLLFFLVRHRRYGYVKHNRAHAIPCNLYPPYLKTITILRPTKNERVFMVSHSGLLRNLIENDGLQKFIVAAGWFVGVCVCHSLLLALPRINDQKNNIENGTQRKQSRKRKR